MHGRDAGPAGVGGRAEADLRTVQQYRAGGGSAGYGGVASVWDAATGRLLTSLTGHTGSIETLAISSDGARVATGSFDGTARIWDAATGAPLLVLRGHDSEIVAVAFSPADDRLVTSSIDATARIWDTRSGALLWTLRGHRDAVEAVAFSPDGGRLVTASVDQTARVWDLATGRLHAELADRIVLRGADGAITFPVPRETLTQFACLRLEPFTSDFAEVAELCRSARARRDP